MQQLQPSTLSDRKSPRRGEVAQATEGGELTNSIGTEITQDPEPNPK